MQKDYNKKIKSYCYQDNYVLLLENIASTKWEKFV